MYIEPADFSKKDVQALLIDYLAFAQQDACSHALGIAALQTPDIQMFTARDDAGNLMGCAALKTLNDAAGEIKSVRTHEDHLRKGVSRSLMLHIELTAIESGLTALYLETHNTPPYAAACALYAKLGFERCGPFGDYSPTPRNLFMMKALTEKTITS